MPSGDSEAFGTILIEKEDLQSVMLHRDLQPNLPRDCLPLMKYHEGIWELGTTQMMKRKTGPEVEGRHVSLE